MITGERKHITVSVVFTGMEILEPLMFVIAVAYSGFNKPNI